MRIATWNVNSIKARLPFVLHWLDAREPDIACLQELKVDADAFPHDELAARGYEVALHGQPTWNGVAVISRAPVELVQAGLPGAEAIGARLLTATTSGLSVTSVYVPNGKTLTHEDFGTKLDFLRALVDYVDVHLEREALGFIGGDFNICPEDRDSWAPNPEHIFHTAAERGLLRRILELGWSDMYRRMHPDGDMFSWWDYRAGCFHKNQGLRIDFLLASRALMARATEVWIDREYRKKKDGHTPSDHAPVIAELLMS